MSNIALVESGLPPGFRFHPTDEELICDYLMKKVTKTSIQHDNPGSPPPPLMIEVNLNKCEPWDIPETACVGGKEWYFYSQRDRKYATGSRTNRATASGYWKATGKDHLVHRKGTVIGMRKTLVFYKGRAPKGRKTDWVMHEFRFEGPLDQVHTNKEGWVLCKVFYKCREAAAVKPSMGGYYDHHHDTVSSSPPPLMDSNYITFEQTPNCQHQDQQVPCFSSILSQNQFTTKNNMIITFGQAPQTTTTTKMETKGSPSIGEISSTSGSYLSQIVISNKWNHY